MNPTPPPVVPPPIVDYQDRRTGLIIFGVFELLFGGLALLMVPLAVVGQSITASHAGQDIPWMMTLTSMGPIAVFAVALIWLGIGSMMARRWARAILLCVAWIGLVMGIVVLLLLPVLLPGMRATMEQQAGAGPEVPPAMFQIMIIITVAVMFFFYVLIPGALVLFYRSRHVKLTCEAHDPVERWTDRCPLPVLALVLMLGSGAFAILLMLPQYSRAFPLFGGIIAGVPALLCWLLMIGLMGWLTVGIYRLERRAWWGYVAFLLFFGTTSVVTFSRINMIDYYQAAGLPEAQLAMLGRSPLMQGSAMLWMVLPGVVLLGGYLIYLRRFFFASQVADS